MAGEESTAKQSDSKSVVVQEVCTNSVQIKLPPFFKQQPQRWFTQAEAQFELRQVTQESTKYCYVLQSLDQDTNARVSEFTDKKPASDPYTTLKEALLKEYTLSEAERAQAFFTLQSPSMATRPSDIMNQLIQLGPTTDPTPLNRSMRDTCMQCQQKSCGCQTREFLFKNIFLMQLPAPIRTQMAGHNFHVNDFRSYAKHADKYWEALKENNRLAATSELAEPVEVAGVNRRTPPSKPQPVDTVCWYHKKHGNNAQKCTGVCSWPKNARGGRV